MDHAPSRRDYQRGRRVRGHASQARRRRLLVAEHRQGYARRPATRPPSQPTTPPTSHPATRPPGYPATFVVIYIYIYLFIYDIFRVFICVLYVTFVFKYFACI